MKLKITFLLTFLAHQIISQNQESYSKWNESYNNGSKHYRLQSFSQAKDEFSKAYHLAKVLFDVKSEEFMSTAYSYAIVLVQIENTIEAAEPMKKALVGIKNLYGETSEPYATGLTVLANIYVNNKSYKLAEEIYLESNDLLKSNYGENHYMYGVALTNLAGFYREIKNYNKALKILNKGLAILKDNPDFNQQYYNNLRYNNLPDIYQGLRRLEDALQIEEESLNYIKTSYGKFTSNYANILTSIGGIQVNLGHFNKAEKTLEEAASIFEYLDNYDDEEALGNVYMFLVACYTEKSDYKNAFYYASQAIRLTKLESDSPPVNALNYYEILANLNWNLNNFEQVREYLEKVIAGTIKSIGENAPQLPVLKSQLGLCYLELDQKEKAEKLIEEAFEEVKKMNYSIRDKEYRQCLDNLNVILVSQKKYKEAIKNLLLTLKEEDKSYPNYWAKAAELANLYLMNNQCNKAFKLLKDVLKETKKIYGKNDPNYISALNSYIFAKACKRKYGNILNNIKEADKLSKDQLIQRFSFSNEGLKRVFLLELEYSFDLYETVNIDFKNDELTTINLENQYLLKGLLLNQSKNLTGKLAELGDDEINSKIEKYIHNKQVLNRLEDKKDSFKKNDIENLRSDINGAEIELVQLYNERFQNPIDFKKSWKKVQNKLNDHEAAIEFSRFNYKTKNSSDSIYYIAYIVNKKFKKPLAIQLFEEKQLAKIFSSKLNPNQLYSSRGAIASKTGFQRDTNAIYNLVWKPIEPYLEDINTIYFSPVGLLHNISFASLNNTGSFLIENINLNQLSSTYELVSNFEQPSKDTILLIGGIDYDYEAIKEKEINIKSNSLDLLDLETKRSRSEKWNYLPGTLNEINNLNKIVSKNNISSTLLKGRLAKETTFKEMSNNSPTIIHIATHGFFFEKKKQNKELLMFSSKESKFRLSENPLKRSGILLSGANYAWINGNNPYEIDNGVLTAEEISNLDLSKTKMVVLSACETGLGDIDGSEGVYGLQRAFKIAGVDIIVMSLWEVPDKETAEFMELFYSKWLEGVNVRDAFINTQRIMAKKYRETPEKWAAFVLVE